MYYNFKFLKVLVTVCILFDTVCTLFVFCLENLLCSMEERESNRFGTAYD